MKQFFIYMTTNLINGKKYIGQHYGNENDSYLGSGVMLTRAIAKYGKENFKRKILEFTTEKEVNEREKYYIALYNAFESDEFYNLTPGGEQLDVKKINEAKEKWQQEHPETHRKQVDAWRMAGSLANSKKVKCLTTGEVFESLCAAARHFNISQGNITRCLKGRSKSAGKHPETGEKLFWELIN